MHDVCSLGAPTKIQLDQENDLNAYDPECVLSDLGVTPGSIRSGVTTHHTTQRSSML